MASGTLPTQRTANVVFAIGWILVIINLACVVYVNAVPFYLESLTKEAFFFIDEMAAVSRKFVLISTAAYVVVLFQALFLGKIAHGIMKDDTPQVGAAEASLRLARITAVVALVLMFYGWLQTVRTDLGWHEGHRLQEQQRQRDWGG